MSDQSSRTAELALELHHVGCATESIEESLSALKGSLGAPRHSEVILVSSQKVKVCFVEIAPGVQVELVEPCAADSSLRSVIERGQSYYHLAYQSSTYEQDKARLEDRDFFELDEFSSEAFGGKRCSFFMAPDKTLLELIEC